MPTLKEVMPHEFLGSEYVGTRALQFLDVEVLAKHEMASKPWPGKHRNVMNWYVLANGMAVGWNESLSRGWSFPVIRYRQKQRGSAIEANQRLRFPLKIPIEK